MQSQTLVLSQWVIGKPYFAQLCSLWTATVRSRSIFHLPFAQRTSAHDRQSGPSDYVSGVPAGDVYRIRFSILL